MKDVFRQVQGREISGKYPHMFEKRAKPGMSTWSLLPHGASSGADCYLSPPCFFGTFCRAWTPACGSDLSIEGCREVGVAAGLAAGKDRLPLGQHGAGRARLFPEQVPVPSQECGSPL